jgi:small-conductance mechanosensitive channel
MERFTAAIPAWLVDPVLITLAVIVAFGIHLLVLKVLRGWAARSPTPVDDLILQRLASPTRFLAIAFALSAVQPTLTLGGTAERAWTQTAGLIVPALLGWLAVGVVGFVADLILLRADISAADNLLARQRRTRTGILHRIAVFVVLVITFCMMLMSIPSVRTIGVTLIASAGLAALAVGAAAQPALKNLIAGLQMAFTEPVRIDDVVVVDAEWGRIEDIRLTYVVVKLWDERRLIVPISKFLEESFQNWTRQTSQILGSVFWYLDPTADISRLREKLEQLVRENDAWDGRFCNLQVTDTKPEAIEVRALMTAADASKAFDLRCDIREGLLAFIRREMPEAIPHRRNDVSLNQPEQLPA